MPASTAAISSRESGRLMSIPETSPTNTGWIWRMDTFMCRLLSPCRLDYNDAVHFGIFVEEMRQGASQRAAFRDVFELAERADAWGIDCVWLAEIHFTPTRSVISASLQVASAMATRTRRLRVGTAVQVLPLNHPLRIAEEVATVDHISEGRFEFGIGRSGVVRTYDIYGVPYGESQARFREALEIIREGWKGVVRASRPSSRARPSWPGPRSDGRAPAAPTAAGSRPSAWPASRTRTSSPGRWRSAPRAA